MPGEGEPKLNDLFLMIREKKEKDKIIQTEKQLEVSSKNDLEH